MTALFLTITAVISGSGPTHASLATQNVPQLKRQVSMAFRRESIAKTPEERATSIKELIQLHEAISTNSDSRSNQTMKRLKAKIRGRLTRVSNELKREASKRQFVRRRNQLFPNGKSLPLAQVGFLDDNAGNVGQNVGLPQTDAQALVELIQTTIAPDSWEVNGGRGAISYFLPKMALVVSASCK